MRRSGAYAGTKPAFFLLVAIAGLLLSIVSASGQTLRPLVVRRADDCADCPTAATLAGLVARQMKRPALTPAIEVPKGGGPALEVQIVRGEKGYTAILQAGNKTRTISDKGSTCAGLSAALAVSIAVLLDTEPDVPHPAGGSPTPAPSASSARSESEEDAGPPLESANPPAPSPPPKPAEPIAPGLDAGDTPPAEEASETATSKVHYSLSLAASPVVTVGLLTAGAWGGTAELELRMGRFSVAAGALLLGNESIAFGHGNTTIGLALGTVRGCVDALSQHDSMRLYFCLEPLVGEVRGKGTGYTDARDQKDPWVGGATSARWQLRLLGPVALRAGAEFVVPFKNASFYVGGHPPFFSPLPVGGVFDVGLGVTIW